MLKNRAFAALNLTRLSKFSTFPAPPSLKKPLFDKILIANRGEIACRIMKTAKKLGVKTVAVYSDQDRNSMHVDMADEAFYIGQSPSSESYLKMDLIIDIARKSGAQAIHPGYGFLSENSDFAEKVASNGLVFIGPPASAIIAMGSKSASKDIMSKAKVPVVPGYHGDNQDAHFLQAQAGKIGYPVLIKAIKGGGGKGMRIVEKEADFKEMLSSSRREAIKSFGDDRVLVEKYLTTPRHVEVQVFCDSLGNAVYLFERDCSVQRRHQKVIEEAPAPNLSEEVRQSLGSKAVAAAKAVAYQGAGTVEFIMDNETQQFYFMEMNTRLQVEHPVTEMITGTDLVEWQLEVASGNRLPKLQNELAIRGHCFETRIYAENPRNNFLPDSGKLIHLRAPVPDQDCRVETGVRQGDTVSVYYDPMIAKLVVWGADRTLALKKLGSALSEYQVVGPSTNIEFLKTLSTHPNFIAAEVETGFIKKHFDTLLPPLKRPSAHVAIQAALGLILHEESKLGQILEASNDVYSPWNALLGTRLGSQLSRSFKFDTPDSESQSVTVECTYSSQDPHCYSFKVEDPASSSSNAEFANVLVVKGQQPERDTIQFVTIFPEERFDVTMVLEDSTIHLFNKGETNSYSSLQIPPPKSIFAQVSKSMLLEVKAPMPSKISQVLVKVGQSVKQGEPLVILEAMKMEHVMRASADCIVSSVKFVTGDLVNEGQVLVTFEDPSVK